MSSEDELEFARVWRSIPKVVFSRTLTSVVGNARLATDDIATEVNRLRQSGRGVVSIGGAGLAGAAIAEDLIDEYLQFVNPVILGGGTPYFPSVAEPLALRLAETRTFNFRVAYRRYERTR
jgi:dihydrofolate reductase